jgi:uncharacterized cupin superfamily protein
MSQHVVATNPATVELVASPFPAEWVIEGRPQAQATAIARSGDGAMTVIAWSCTKGRFRWKYDVDEMAHILSGEVFITDESGTERRLGPGDTVFFASGSTCLWRITEDVRKVAVCHVAVPPLVSLGLRAWNKICRIASEILGLDDESVASGLTGAKPMGVARPNSAAAAPPA